VVAHTAEGWGLILISLNRGADCVRSSQWKLGSSDQSQHFGLEVLMMAIMKIYVFWCITLCRPVKLSGRFEGYHLHLQGRRVSQQEISMKHPTNRAMLLFCTTQRTGHLIYGEEKLSFSS
jgi:hypothetical protein